MAAFFPSRLILRALTQLQNHVDNPSLLFTRSMRQIVPSQSALDAAAERRRRKRKLRLEPPFGALQRNRENARHQPPKSNLPEPITVLVGDRLSLHNRIQSLCHSNKLDDALLCIRHAMFSNCRPTIFTINYILGHLQQANRHADVISTFKFIFHAGVIPNVVTYNVLISTHCENLNIVEAYNVFKTLCASEVVKPSHVTFNHLMTAQFKLKNYDAVMEIFREMLEKCNGADPPTYAAAIEGFVNGGSMDHATEIYQEMRKRGSIFSETVFCNLIRGYFIAGKVEEAMEVFDFVPDKVERTVLSYNAVLQGMCSTGRVKEAEEFFKKMVSLKPNADSYAILMSGLIGEGKLDEAIRVYRSGSEDLSNGAVVYNVLLDGLLKAGRVLECEEIVEEMVQKRCEPNEVSYNLLVDGFFREGRVEECLRSFRRLLDAGFSPGLGVYSRLFAYLCDVGKLDEVRELFERMVDVGLVPDVAMYDVLVGGFGKEGRVDEVMRFFREVLEKGVASEELVARITEDLKLQTQVLNVMS